MIAGRLNITIQQGATFSNTIFLKDDDGNPIDLSGASVRSQIRPAYDSSSFVAFDISIVAPATNGEILWEMDASTTEGINLSLGTIWVYDVEVEYASGVVQRILQGSAIISPEATRT